MVTKCLTRATKGGCCRRPPDCRPATRWVSRRLAMVLAVQAALLALLPSGGALAEESLAASASRSIRVERNLVFRTIDGEQVKADVYRPDDEAVYPLVLMIHGGAWSTGDKWNLQDHAREMAQAGFVAVSINYRLAPKHPYPAQLDDCRFALKWAAQQVQKWNADASRIGLWGYSAGAHLAAMLAMNPQDGDPKILAAVAGGAPCEFSFIPKDNRVIAHVMGGTPAERPQVYDDASPLAYASQDSCPTFFFHGTKDLLVPPSSSRKLFEKLSELAVETEYYRVENRGHLLTFLHSDARRRAISFLKKHMTEGE